MLNRGEQRQRYQKSTRGLAFVYCLTSSTGGLSLYAWHRYVMQSQLLVIRGLIPHGHNGPKMRRGAWRMWHGPHLR